MAKINPKDSLNKDRNEKHQLQDVQIKETLRHIKNKIVIMSGKGGVGKSSIAAYLSVALANRGHMVGLMDVDLHGPSIPRLLGLKGQLEPAGRSHKVRPVKYRPNMEVISIETLMGENKDVATIWRGPLKIGAIRQFMSDIEWMNLDYLIIDSPPGTGDEPLTVAQTITDAKALIVTTPQEISLADVRKSINFCREVNMEILGLVENMSGLTCPFCGKMIELFKINGGMLTSKKESLRFLGSLPIEPKIVQDGDMGNVNMLNNDQLTYTKAFDQIVAKIVKLNETDEDFPIKPKENKMPTNKKVQGNGAVIVIPESEGKLSAHFGHCNQFAFVETESGKIKKIEMRTPPPHEPGVLPNWLKEQGATVIIAGGIGAHAQQILRDNGIEVVVGVPADSPEFLANQYLSNRLTTGENICDH